MATKKKDTSELDAMAMSAFEISVELRNVVQTIIDAGGECSDEQLEALKAWNIAIENKGENICRVIDKLDNESELYAAVERRAYSRRKARADTVLRLKKYLAECMRTAGVKSIKKTDGLFSITLCDGKPSVKIDDPSKLNIGETVDIVESLVPRTDEIKKRILSEYARREALPEDERKKLGDPVPGAHVEYGPSFLQIR